MEQKKKKRKMHPRSLENLIPGGRRGKTDGKVRINTRVLPETKEWLLSQGQMGAAIDQLVARLKTEESQTFPSTHLTESSGYV